MAILTSPLASNLLTSPVASNLRCSRTAVIWPNRFTDFPVTAGGYSLSVFGVDGVGAFISTSVTYNGIQGSLIQQNVSSLSEILLPNVLAGGVNPGTGTYIFPGSYAQSQVEGLSGNGGPRFYSSADLSVAGASQTAFVGGNTGGPNDAWFLNKGEWLWKLYVNYYGNLTLVDPFTVRNDGGFKTTPGWSKFGAIAAPWDSNFELISSATGQLAGAMGLPGFSTGTTWALKPSLPSKINIFGSKVLGSFAVGQLGNAAYVDMQGAIKSMQLAGKMVLGDWTIGLSTALRTNGNFMSNLGREGPGWNVIISIPDLFWNYEEINGGYGVYPPIGTTKLYDISFKAWRSNYTEPSFPPFQA